MSESGQPEPRPIDAEVMRERVSARVESRRSMGGETVRYGVTMGTALAITISYARNGSVLWAIIHGFLSWVYVLYHLLFH